MFKGIVPCKRVFRLIGNLFTIVNPVSHVNPKVAQIEHMNPYRVFILQGKVTWSKLPSSNTLSCIGLEVGYLCQGWIPYMSVFWVQTQFQKNLLYFFSRKHLNVSNVREILENLPTFNIHHSYSLLLIGVSYI